MLYYMSTTDYDDGKKVLLSFMKDDGDFWVPGALQYYTVGILQYFYKYCKY